MSRTLKDDRSRRSFLKYAGAAGALTAGVGTATGATANQGPRVHLVTAGFEHSVADSLPTAARRAVDVPPTHRVWPGDGRVTTTRFTPGDVAERLAESDRLLYQQGYQSLPASVEPNLDRGLTTKLTASGRPVAGYGLDAYPDPPTVEVRLDGERVEVRGDGGSTLAPGRATRLPLGERTVTVRVPAGDEPRDGWTGRRVEVTPTAYVRNHGRLPVEASD